MAARFITDVEELRTFQHKEVFAFNCIRCGSYCEIKRELSVNNQIKAYNSYGGLVCGHCKFQQNYPKEQAAQKHRDWYNNLSEEEKQARNEAVTDYFNNLTEEELAVIVGKRKKTKLERHGDENYNNREQARETNIKDHGNPGPKFCVGTKEFSKRLEEIHGPGVTHASKIPGIQERSIETAAANVGYDGDLSEIHSVAQLPQVKAKIIATNQERLGVDFPFQSQDIQDKGCEVREERYDDPHYNNRPKAKETCLERYGVENLFCLPEMQEYARQRNEEINCDRNYNNPEKNKATCQERYGVDYAIMAPEVQAKIAATNLERYNTEVYFKSEDFREKSRQTCMEHFDHPTYLGSKECIEHCKQIFNELFGVDYYMQTQEFREKSRQTCIRKYNTTTYNNVQEQIDLNTELRGVPYYFQSKEYQDFMLNTYGTLHPSFKYNWYGETFDSSWELAVWIYCIDHNIPVVRNKDVFYEYPDINGKIHKYNPDFIINGNVIEIKGNHFFDESGKLIYPYNKKKVDGVWIELTPEEKEYMNDLYERKHQCGLSNGVIFWKEEDIIPYLQYCNMMYPGWSMIFYYNNPYNPSYWLPTYTLPVLSNGVTPYDIKPEDKYILDSSTKGVTPFDLKH